MKLTKITLKNFASYYGETTFELGVSKGKPIVVVVGDTGFGKTSLFDAINWTLYGEDYANQLPETRDGRRIEDFVHSQALAEAAKSNEYVEMSSILYFEHDTKKYCMSRSIKGMGDVVNGKTILGIPTYSTRLLEITEEGDTIMKEAHKTFLDDILPSNVRSYFLFDGDRINNLTKPGSSEQVRDAIYKVVDLEIIQNSVEHFRKLAEEYNKEARKKSSGELKEINDKYNAEKKEVQKLEELISNLKKEQRAVDRQIKIIDEKREKAPESAKLQGDLNTLRSQVKSVDADLQREKLLIKEKLPLVATGLVKTEIKELHDHINKKREKGEIPRHISETLINDLLSMGKCICSEDLSKKMRASLEARLEQEKGKSIEEHQILELFYGLQSLPGAIQEQKEQISLIEDNILESESKKADWIARIQEIENELEHLPQEDAAELTKKHQQFQKDRDKIIGRLGNAVRDLEEAQDRLFILKGQRKEKGKEQKEVQLLQTQAELCERSANAVQDLYGEFAEDSRKEVEKLTREEFERFVASAKSYKVNITKDFDFEVLDKNGNESLNKLSMGQKQCLSLAFILAISRVSQKNPPIVYDMPFGRLSQKVNTEITKRLPHLAEQLILFLIPGTEWNETTQTYLQEHCAHIHELELNEDQLITSLI